MSTEPTSPDPASPDPASPGPTGPAPKSARRWLIREVLLLQVKLLLGAARDLALTPITLVAAAIDFVRAKQHAPRWFPLVLRLGEQSDHWIDLWRAGHAEDAPQRENVDALLARIEGVVRDPSEGARHARVLKRWAERRMARARKRNADDAPKDAGPPTQ